MKPILRISAALLVGLMVISATDAQSASEQQRFQCSDKVVMNATPKIGQTKINGDLVFLNGRIAPNNEAFWDLPQGKAFLLTDIIVQNRAPGDSPVSETSFTRFVITSPLNVDELPGQNIVSGDIFFTVVGNTTFSQHFESAMPITARVFRFLNVINSSAPFVEFTITGVLADCAHVPSTN